MAAAVAGGALVVTGAYALTTQALSAPAVTPAAAHTAGPGEAFLVAVCVTQPRSVRVPDQRCVAAARAAADTGTDPARATVVWRFVPSSTTTPAGIPPLGAEVTAGDFTAAADLPRYTEDALDIYGRPTVHQAPGTHGIVTGHGTI